MSNTGNDGIAKKNSGKMDLPYPEHHQKKEARASRNKIHAVSRPLLKASLPLQDIYLFLPAFDGRVTHFIYQRQKGGEPEEGPCESFSPSSFLLPNIARGEGGKRKMDGKRRILCQGRRGDSGNGVRMAGWHTERRRRTRCSFSGGMLLSSIGMHRSFFVP